MYSSRPSLVNNELYYCSNMLYFINCKPKARELDNLCKTN